MFNLWRTYKSVFQRSSWFPIPISGHVRVPTSPYPPSCLLSDLLILAFLVGMSWYLVVLICISLTTSGTERLFMCLLAIGTSFLVKCLFRCFDYLKHLITWSFKDYWGEYKNMLYIPDIRFVIIFFHLVGHFFTFLMMSGRYMVCNYLYDIWFVIIFFHLVGHFFTFLMMSALHNPLKVS